MKTNVLSMIFCLLLILCSNAVDSTLLKKLSKTQKSESTVPPIRQGCAIIYADCGFAGKSLTVCSDSPDLRRLGFDKIMSAIRLGPNTKVTLFNGYNFQGQSALINQDNGSFCGSYLNDWPSSLRISQGAPVAQGPRQGCVWIYQDCGYAGRKVEVCNSIPDLRSIGFDKIMSAIKLGPNTQVNLFNGYNYSGQKAAITQDNGSFCGSYLNDWPSSLCIGANCGAQPQPQPQGNSPRQGCIWIYQDCNFGGRKVEVCNDIPDLRSLGFDKIMSAVKLGPNTEVDLYNGFNYAGTPAQISKDNGSFCGTYLNDWPSSLKVVTECKDDQPQGNSPRKGCIWIYQDCNFGGRKVEVCNDIPDLRSIGFDKIMSAVKLGPDTEVDLFNGYSYAGTPAQISKDNGSFCGTYLNDWPSSLKVITECKDNQPQGDKPRKGCAWIYQDCNFGGRKVEVCNNIPDLRTIGFDKIMSAVKLGPETEIDLFNGFNYAGTPATLTKDNGSFCGTYLNDWPSSLKVVACAEDCEEEQKSPKQGCAWIYQDCNFGGRKVEVCNDVPNLATLEFDKIMSAIKLGPNTQVNLFNGANYLGTPATITKDNGSFCGSPLNDWPSSLCFGANCGPKKVTISGFIKDATTAQIINYNDLEHGNVKVNFVSAYGTFTAKVAEDSSYSVDIPVGTYNRTTTVDGYSANTASLTVTDSSDKSTDRNTVLLVPVIEGWNAVLTWNDQVKDLDLYTILSNGELIFYRNKLSSDGKVSLDVDARQGWGPETISYKKINQGKFKILVHNYSNEKPLPDSKAVVTLYRNGKQIDRLDVPTTLADPNQRYWNVFEIDMDSSSTGTFRRVNTFQADLNQ